ncbi:hypothetical protein LCGC14_0767750 [marine sediment metagenome]|uniref:Uncharacterized protein n=1 Tax=marine sediment metagenome TaxID=412755 RepID=A0A0F9PZB6_9ZZZZ
MSILCLKHQLPIMDGKQRKCARCVEDMAKEASKKLKIKPNFGIK